MDLGPERPPWKFSRLVLASPNLARIRERLEFVRGFFPEIATLTIRVGLVRKPGVLGWGSLDPAEPGVWVRPRRLDRFTIAHEFTHLLQARGLVPLGERACDLFALARSSLLVDQPPGYLKVPREMLSLHRLNTAQGKWLHEAARRALDVRARGDRHYLKWFEREVAATWRVYGKRPMELAVSPA
ncbi:MAG: hypothetical protein E6K80_00515 [Candidatus Eisenbacteria bacterium]|uniref:Uncharacterized protein n=1 Tax=Eiseniibacteriota bacterium TaxID=2212470 RepID=A0A538UBK4_UNCEI|nr:MAG: hypothetical protein E6K80_00515 [Candidatus Eisenbacteria bacterium]